MSPIEQYRQGQYAAVWDELSLVDLSDPYHRAQAEEVATDFALRVKSNVVMIVDRLLLEGYEFGKYPNGAAIPGYVGPLVSSTDVAHRLSVLERSYGSVPFILRALWTVVGSIDLCGRHAAVPVLADPLVVLGIEAAESELRVNPPDEWDEPPAVPISPDVLHKADQSGGPFYRVRTGGLAFDARVQYQPEELLLGEYVRRSLQSGGFLGNGLGSLKDRLTRDLQPL
ncbi:MAG TPA: hypothetical protein VM686_04515 [Polyangiaceae bacterium]|nr:hypothetical protein [Polyangiaceae bacterium]